MYRNKRLGISVIVVVSMLASLRADESTSPSGANARNAAETEFVALHDAYVAKYKPLYRRQREAWWDSNITGTDEAFAQRKKVEAELIELHSDREVFSRLKALRGGGQVRDPVLTRQLDVMYRTFLPGQADPQLQKRIVGLEADVEQIFNTHRGLVRGRPATENDIRKILREATDPALVEEAWNAYMEVGAKVAPKLKELVLLRNQLARELGYESFYSMKLFLQEIDPAELFKLFDELDTLTAGPFLELKRRIDAMRAARFGITPADLRPWHYGDLFFQEAPDLDGPDLDTLFQDKDLIGLAKTYYAGLGMPVESILARSDLYEKPGKSPHAFCTDMDRAGDIRILCNLKPDAYWIDTLLHELGHAVYDRYIAPDIPFILHQASHGLTTEGIAMMFGAMTRNEDWLARVLRIDPARASELVRSARQALQAEKLIFSRWTQVMVRFEHGMYSQPDRDLGRLWWDLKKRYQLLTPPEDPSRPDYGAKNHIVTTPVYYHNYMMGDLFACQVHRYIARNVLGETDPGKTCFFGHPEAGEYLKENVFGPGNLYSWNDLTRRATGEPLSAAHFVQLLVKRPEEPRKGP